MENSCTGAEGPESVRIPQRTASIVLDVNAVQAYGHGMDTGVLKRGVHANPSHWHGTPGRILADRLLSAMRKQFGGRDERKKGCGNEPAQGRPEGIRRADTLRRDGGSRPQDDLPGALCDDQARGSQRAGDRCSSSEVEPGAIAQTD